MQMFVAAFTIRTRIILVIFIGKVFVLLKLFFLNDLKELQASIHYRISYTCSLVLSLF